MTTSTEWSKSKSLFTRALQRIPGGVNSPVRAFGAVGGDPLIIASGSGPWLFDVDGHRFIDWVGAYGPLILGHAHSAVVAAVKDQASRGFGYGASTELEVELAETIATAVPGVEKLRLVSSGTEAAMTALRIARAATGRPLVLKFDGCYHGHSDGLLVSPGSGGMTLGIPASAGVPPAIASLTVVVPYNSLEAVERAFAEAKGQIAAVIVEPIAANMGVVPPVPGFLEGLRELTRRNGALLIFDEVITGFRLRYGAVQEIFGIRADLTLFGKIIGGGMPIGAVGGRADLMDLLAPEGAVYQAGTLSGNPVAVSAGLATLAELRKNGVYERLEALAARLAGGLKKALVDAGIEGQVSRAGSMLTLFFNRSPVSDAAGARTSDTKRYAAFFRAMLGRGIYLPPSQFEAMFVSMAHTEAEVDATVSAAAEALREIR